MARCGGKGPFGPFLYMKEENMNEKNVKKAVNAAAKAEWALSKAMNRLAKVTLVPKNKKALAKTAERARKAADKLEVALLVLVEECSIAD